MQPLQKNQTFIFQFKREFYLGVNDGKSKFSAKNDLFLSLGKAAIDQSVGKFSTKDYFANNTVGFEL
ncbi:MAG: bluetail domain-containing putative surface protein [Leptolyngbyaceae bacterium]|nr:bluetail domain-containing putative surface protein [Leptolyngbyaceae bacterium]